MNEQTGNPQVVAESSLAELERLIDELKAHVGSLRDGEFDAVTLDRRLRELNELAGRAVAALDSVTR